MDKQIAQLAQQLGQALKEQNKVIATAESCTGGGIAQAITDIPGSSNWFDRGFVTYSNQSKIEMLQVNPLILEQYGAVSEAVAKEMAVGVLLNSDVDLSVSVTGIAGPTGGSIQKPVGSVYIAWQLRGGKINCLFKVFSGNRGFVRQKTILCALSLCINQLLYSC